MNTHKNLENSCRDAYVSFPMKNLFSLLRLMDATKEILIEGGKFTMFLQLQYTIYLPDRKLIYSFSAAFSCINTTLID